MLNMISTPSRYFKLQRFLGELIHNKKAVTNAPLIYHPALPAD
jgi:hypothetical protein